MSLAVSIEVAVGGISFECLVSSWTLIIVTSPQSQNFTSVHFNFLFYDVDSAQVEIGVDSGVSFRLHLQLLELGVNSDAVHAVDGSVHIVLAPEIVRMVGYDEFGQ